MKKLWLILSVFIIVRSADAVFDVRYTTVGQWEAAISNFGKFGQSPTGNSYGAFWPRGSGHNYIFGAGMWIGVIAPNGDSLVTIGYGPHGGEYECAPGVPYSDPFSPQWHVYFSSDLDYPLPVVSLEDAYSIYNDFNINYHMVDDTRPIGITITQKTFTWLTDWAEDVLFLKYIVKNDTTFTIPNIYAGYCVDFDIGDEAGTGNDRYGVDLSRKLFYGWQDDPEPGWATRGMLGLKLLSPTSLTAFKHFTLNLDLYYDWERYMALAGYNWETGAYEPFDTAASVPDDQRILMATGPLNLAPGDSIILDWALIASHDEIPPSPDMQQKADRAQSYYDYGPHNVVIIQPNGGEVVSGNYPILYNAIPVTPNPLLLDFYLMSLNLMDTVALSQDNTGNYTWNTIPFPDGVLYKVIAIGYDTLSIGGDMSDNIFTINNPGNAPPYIKPLMPKIYNDSTLVDTISKNAPITWFARDPEFQDSLLIDIYFKGQYDSQFYQVALNEPNDSFFTWNNLNIRNGLGSLVLQTHDEEFTVAETIPAYLLNQLSSGPISHINGLNNILDIQVFVHQPESLTGHAYELEFLQYRGFLSYSQYYLPEYFYKITDLNTSTTILDNYSLIDGYFIGNFGILKKIDDFSPIINGFSVRAHTIQDNIINSQNFINDSVRVILGAYPQDSIILWASGAGTWWAYRGSRLQLDWVLKPSGGLTLLVTDLDYGDTIPYKPYSSTWNSDSAYGWCFWGGGTPSDTLRPGWDVYIWLCGCRLRMMATGVFPQVGDRWIVYPSEYSPPIKGNVYQFTPINYVAENKTGITKISFQVFPVPFTKNLTIAYALPRLQKIDLAIYDVTGRQVRKLKDGMEKAGAYRISWKGMDDHGRRISSGIYFCRFKAEDYQETRKFILIK